MFSPQSNNKIQIQMQKLIYKNTNKKVEYKILRELSLLASPRTSSTSLNRSPPLPPTTLVTPPVNIFILILILILIVVIVVIVIIPINVILIVGILSPLPPTTLVTPPVNVVIAIVVIIAVITIIAIIVVNAIVAIIVIVDICITFFLQPPLSSGQHCHCHL